MAIKFHYHSKLENESYWLCRCDCGCVLPIKTRSLKRGVSVSCGCVLPKKHGYSKSKLYIVLYNMKSRCYNKNANNYEDYGGRGVSVCEEWLGDTRNFISWALVNGYSPELQIDRRDNDGNYTPSNCRFVTRLTNNHNQRMRKDNTSGFRGVSMKSNGRFRVQLQQDRKKLNVGTFSTALEAAVARNTYIKINNLPHKLS